MHGTDDIDKITTWVTAIDCLKQATKKKSFEEWLAQVCSLNTTSEYGMFLLELFGAVEETFLLNKTFDYYKEALYSNVLSAKIWQYYEKVEVVKAAPKVNPRWHQYVAQTGAAVDAAELRRADGGAPPLTWNEARARDSADALSRMLYPAPIESVAPNTAPLRRGAQAIIERMIERINAPDISNDF
jgi:hypothetical protein